MNSPQADQRSILAQLDAIIAERKSHGDPQSSYVAQLFARGLNKILEKVGEESVEVILAAKQLEAASSASGNAATQEQRDLVGEVADLWFHSLVALQQFDLDSDDVLAQLASRFGISGIEEKAGRNQAP